MKLSTSTVSPVVTPPITSLGTRLVPAFTALALSSITFAQGVAAGPRQPKIDSVPSPVIGYALLAVMAIVILSISLYPSKRAHSDI
jgi:hypothetical protein